ncbi:MAG: hypothetical protein CME70_05060 [Halobacteriovorax sp.]|nr:hypothetical protein [Halobacteriovorax sp.]|tara:strand:- start:42384 stop:44381 length:1998 start_codon:yes stop_codon:yes gene_type:complete
MKFMTWVLICAIVSFASIAESNAKTVVFKNFKVKKQLFQEYQGPFKVTVQGDHKVLLEEDDSIMKSRGIKDNPLYQKIVKRVKEELLNQANKITSDTIKYNQSYALGDTNFSGFKWGGLIGGAGINAGRRLYPDYTASEDDKRWVVEDRFEIEVDAKTFLKNLSDSGSVEISNSSLNAFAGIRFRRTYTYIHFAESYLKGLTRDFDKLFLGFLKFGGSRFLSLEDHESISRKDYLSAHLSADAETPSYYFLSAYAGGTLRYSRVNDVSIHRPGSRDLPRENEILRVSVNKSRITGKAVTVGLQADFFNLLKVSLLSFEYSKNLNESSFLSMSFRTHDEDLLDNKDSILHQEVKDVLRGKLPENNLALMPFVISEQDTKRDSESMNTHLFLFDKVKGNSTSEVTVRNSSGTKYMFRHNEEESTYKKSWLQALFSSKKINKYKRRITDTVNFEYQVRDDERHLSLEEIKLDDADKAYLRFSKEINAPKIEGNSKKKVRKELVSFGKVYTNIEERVWKSLADGHLKGSATISVNAEIGGMGISSLESISSDEWKGITRWVCVRVDGDNDPGRLKKAQKKCLKSLRESFSEYKKVFEEEARVSARALRNLISGIAKYARGFNDLELIFGQENVGISGYFSAKTHHGFPYVTYFTLGDDQGKGLIQDALQ